MKCYLQKRLEMIKRQEKITEDDFEYGGLTQQNVFQSHGSELDSAMAAKETDFLAFS